MSGKGPSKSQAIHARLRHSVIDSDGHWREFEPIAMDYLRDCAGPKIVEKWTSRFRGLGQGSFGKKSSRWDELERSVMSGLWTAVPEELVGQLHKKCSSVVTLQSEPLLSSR